MTAQPRPQTATDAVRSLRSTRSYAPASISDDEIRRWIDAVRWCGSSKNTQPWRFIAVRDRTTLDALAALGHHSGQLRDAAVAVAIAMRRTAIPFSLGVDLGRIAQSLMLVAQEAGYGSCIAVLEPASNVDAARALLSVPADHDLDLIISFGVAAPEPPLPPGAVRVSPLGRLPVADLLSWERMTATGDDPSATDAQAARVREPS